MIMVMAMFRRAIITQHRRGDCSQNDAGAQLECQSKLSTGSRVRPFVTSACCPELPSPPEDQHQSPPAFRTFHLPHRLFAIPPFLVCLLPPYGGNRLPPR